MTVLSHILLDQTRGHFQGRSPHETSVHLKRRQNLLAPFLRRQELAHGIALVWRMDTVLGLPPADEKRCSTGCLADRRDDGDGRAVPLELCNRRSDLVLQLLQNEFRTAFANTVRNRE